MARTTIAIVALAAIFGCLTRGLPAQESSRRTVKYRTDPPAASGVRPNLPPPPRSDSQYPAATTAGSAPVNPPSQYAPPPTSPPNQCPASAFQSADQPGQSEPAPPA